MGDPEGKHSPGKYMIIYVVSQANKYPRDQLDQGEVK